MTIKDIIQPKDHYLGINFKNNFWERLKLALVIVERPSMAVMSFTKFELAIPILFDKINKTCPLEFGMTPPIATGPAIPKSSLLVYYLFIYTFGN